MMRISERGFPKSNNIKTKQIQTIILREKKKKRLAKNNGNEEFTDLDNTADAENTKKDSMTNSIETKVNIDKNINTNTNQNTNSNEINLQKIGIKKSDKLSTVLTRIKINKTNRKISLEELRERKKFQNSFESNDFDSSVVPERVNVFDMTPTTIPSLSRPAMALKVRGKENNDEFLRINSIVIRPEFLEKKLKNKKNLKKIEMLTRRQSNIVYRVQIIQNEIIKNFNLRKQLYYFGNKNVEMNGNISQMDKNSVTKETKRKIRALQDANEQLKRKRYEIYLKYNQKSDFSDFGIYKNFFFFIGDFSDAFWMEVRKIVKSGNEKPDYAVTRLARSGVEGKSFDIIYFIYFFKLVK